MKNLHSRAKAGQIYINHKGVLIPTSVGSTSYESVYGPGAFWPRTPGNVPAAYKHRPELIADLFLGHPGSWWVICERNNIFDIFEELKSGSYIRIPT